MHYKTIKFPRSGTQDFSTVLKKRVNRYFEQNGISRHANTGMILKSVFMVTLYIAPYILMITGVVTGRWALLGMWLLMGFGIAGIGMAVMHDANHGSYSGNKKVNAVLGYLLNFVGGDALNWKLQHNVLHHSFTNLDGADDDLAPVGILRFSPHAKKRGIHRFQFLYVWFFYGLMTFSWVISKDFNKLSLYHKMKLTKGENKSFGRLLAELLVSKALYIGYMLVIPMVFLPVPWYTVLLFFFCMHFIAGLSLACIFQPAHVMPDLDFPEPERHDALENDWAAHQLYTTCNFAPDNRLLSWFVGGLNFQIEHHLFPYICHVHYRALSPIVRQTAREFDIPYKSHPSFSIALYRHASMLYALGK